MTAVSGSFDDALPVFGAMTDGAVGGAELGPDEVPEDESEAVPDREVIDLLEPREGLPPVIAGPAELAEAVERLAAGTGPLAVDAERASG
jgi:ribonuclease D